MARDGMQFTALEKEIVVFADEARRQHDYSCPECKGNLRLRQGLRRRPHFYHLKKPKTCTQHKKSLTHLLLQYRLLQILPKGEVQIEKRYPSIDRIADVAWEKRKIIFEIQCSPISLEEGEHWISKIDRKSTR